MNKANILVVVLSRNYSTGLGVIRSLGSAGYTVDLLASTKKKGSSVIAASSKYVRNCVEVQSYKIQEDSGDTIIDCLENYNITGFEKVVLFPTDDFTASVVANNLTVLKKKYIIPGVTLQSKYTLLELMNKTIQNKLANESGLKTAEECMISLREDVDVSAIDIFPCFVKPVQSILGQKMEMKVCSNRTELEIHLINMQQFYRDRDVLIQEFLPVEKEYDLSGVCLDNEIIIPAVIEKSQVAQYERGVTMAGTVVENNVLSEVFESITNMLKKFHYVGMFDMEFIQANDNIYFNEINLRSGGPNFAYFLCGANLPQLTVQYLCGENVSGADLNPISTEKTFVYEKVAWEDYNRGFLTKSEMHHIISNADYTLLEYKDDPKPGKFFNRRIRLSTIKHKIKNKNRKTTAKVTANSTVNRVVIAGRNYGNIISMTRALGEAGYAVDILRIYKKKPSKVNPMHSMEPDACSRYVNNFERIIVNKTPFDVIQKLIEMGDQDSKPVLFPVDDYTACVIDENLDLLKPYFYIPSVNNKQGKLSELMDKQLQKEKGQLFNIPMLQGVLIKCVNGIYEIPDSITYPCFLKPNVSMKSTKGKMRRCNDKESLSKTLELYAKGGDFEILVEEFADIKAEYSVLGISTPDFVYSPGVFKALIGGHRERKGVAVTGELCGHEKFEDILEKCNRYIADLGYIGIFDVDLLETMDGRIYFVELNFRAGASTHVLTKAGINLPAMMADYFLGNEVELPDVTKLKTGQKFVSEKVLLEEYIRNDIDRKTMNRIMAESDVCFIYDENDAKPYEYFKKYFLVATAMKLPYKIKDSRKQ